MAPILHPDDLDSYILEWMDDDCGVLDQEAIAVPKENVVSHGSSSTGLQWVFENLAAGHWPIPDGATQFSVMRKEE